MSLGNVLRKRRRFDEAAARYRRAIEIAPDYAEAHNNLGVVLDDPGQSAEAAEHFRKALEINPEYVYAHNNLGVLLLRQGKCSDAIEHFQAAIALAPKFAQPHANMGRALSLQGRNAEAAAQWRTFLRLKPDQPQIMTSLAWLLATAPEDRVRSGKDAVELAQKAKELLGPHRDVAVLNALAAAYAETGRYGEAIQVAEEALALASAAGSQPLAAALQRRIACYRGNKPFRQPASR